MENSMKTFHCEHCDTVLYPDEKGRYDRVIHSTGKSYLCCIACFQKMQSCPHENTTSSWHFFKDGSREPLIICWDCGYEEFGDCEIEPAIWQEI